MRILFVDNTAETISLVREMFGRRGIAVDVATSADMALEHALLHPPKFIVAKACLWDGFLLLQRWKRDRRWSGIPFIAFSRVFSDSEDAHFARALGADTFVVQGSSRAAFVDELLTLEQRIEAGEFNPPQTPTLPEFSAEHFHGRLVRKLEEKARQIENTEYQLKFTQECYRALFESNPYPMLAYDLATFRFLAVNDAALQFYGYTREEWLAMTIRDIRPPEDVPAIENHLRTRRRNQLISGIWRHRKKDGTVVFVEISSHAINFDGRDARLSLVHDVTDRHRADEQARAQLDELRRWQGLTLGREQRILELKHELNKLLRRCGEPPRYASAA